MGKDIKWGDLIKRHYFFFTGIEVDSLLEIPDHVLLYYTLENKRAIESVVALGALSKQSSSVRSLSARTGIHRNRFRKWVENPPTNK